MTEHLGEWSPLSPVEMAAKLAGLNIPWWIAGGWALDLFLGRQTRPHADIDVEVPRDFLPSLALHLGSWELHCAAGDRLWLWDCDEPVPGEVNSLWCRENASGPWRLQVMLAAVRRGRWTYRRDRMISRPLDTVGLETADGIPYLAPGIQLLYKAKDPRDKDEADFDAVAGKLNEFQRSWLIAALDEVSPGHPWRERLTAGRSARLNGL